MVKALTNCFAGRLSDQIGRKAVLVGGWIVAAPVPFMLMWAPSWNWGPASSVNRASRYFGHLRLVEGERSHDVLIGIASHVHVREARGRPVVVDLAAYQVVRTLGRRFGPPGLCRGIG